MTNTLDRHIVGARPITAAPIRSLSTQHIGSGLPLRSPSIRRMRQLLELGGPPVSPGSVISGHQSPAPTPSKYIYVIFNRPLIHLKFYANFDFFLLSIF